MQSEVESIKHHRYDPSMSRRTRKPQVVVTNGSPSREEEQARDRTTVHNSLVGSETQEDELPEDCNGNHYLSVSSLVQDTEVHKDSSGIHRSSLKELMTQSNGQEKTAGVDTDQADIIVEEMKAALSQEKSSLALVPLQVEGLAGAKRGGMMSRYVKALSHLIKAKRDSKKKPTVRLLKP